MSGYSRYEGKAGERNKEVETEIWLETGKKGQCNCCSRDDTILWFEGMWMCPECLIEHINEAYNMGLHLEF